MLEKRKRRLLSQFKDLLYSISSFVSTGRSLGQALEESIDFWRGTYDDQDYIMRELKQMTKNIKESNMPDVDSFDDFAKRSGLEDAEDFVMVCKTCKATGADFFKAAERSAGIIEDKIDIERELSSIMVQKRFEGRVIASSPFGLILMIKILSPDYMAPLYETTLGRAVSTISLVLMAAEMCIRDRQYLIPYLISSHPGSTLKDAVELALFLKEYGFVPDQVQDFYPTPGTLATCMYYTEMDPLTMEPVYVAKTMEEKKMQRALIHFHKRENSRIVAAALKKAGREDLIPVLSSHKYHTRKHK